MYPNAPEIKTTVNYDLFKLIEWNRDINSTNLKKLVEENRKKFQLHKFPILVTKEGKIIDGQHRYKASMTLGSPVYYIVAEDMDETIQSVHSVNKVGKKHSVGDKFEMLHKSGDAGAIEIVKVYNLYQGVFDKHTILMVMAGSGDNGDTLHNIDKHGKVVLTNREMGLEVLDALYYGNLPEKGKARTVFALNFIVNKSGVHPKAIVKRVEENGSKWVAPKSRPDCVKSILACYNYKLKESRIAITGYIA